MLQRKSLIITALAATATIAVSCASKEPKEAQVETPSKVSQAAAEVGATYYTVIDFPAGKNTVNDTEKQKLRQLAGVANARGDVKEIQVLAWADREYPAEGQKVSSGDKKLADDRLAAVKDYFKKDLQSDADIESHNMAKRPGFFAEMVNSEDNKTKNAFEQIGAAPNDIGPRQALMGNKASKAVILVKYE
ncbi:hypothetical protein [Bdellovibrio sp. HCB274]|uniref:hypothetical protein n=1 Tax=Bdellovibrio sp. HCB274 TaxID=3394361 RepID=UPI0039B58714